jgi:malonyl-CoA/methylmalonyl-CoA synthetase
VPAPAAGATLPGVFARPAPDTVLLRWPGAPPLTYGGASAESARLARALGAAGVGPGDRVVVQLPKSPVVVLLYLACVRAGAVLVPLNPAYTAAETAALLADAEPALVVGGPADAGAGADLLGGAGTTGSAASASTSFDSVENHPVGPEDLAAILYTSGTTGRPKGALLSHRALASNAVALHRAWGFRPEDVLLHALPLFHTHGLFVALNTALVNGTGVVLLARFDVDDVLAHLPGCTVFMGVPTFYTRLLADPRLDAARCRSVRLFTCGSAPLSASTHAEFRARTGHAIVERYGLTETNILTSNPLDHPRPGTVGMPLPGTEVRVQSAPGGVGPVLARGPGLASGYRNQPEAWDHDHTPDGWFDTGDLGSFDRDGYLRLVGRSKDLIISGGLNVYPSQVEEVLDSLPGVAESAVIGLPDPDFGEVVVAVVVTDGTDSHLDVEALRMACRERLASFKVPKRVHQVAALPRNAMGKVEKARLRAELGAPS